MYINDALEIKISFDNFLRLNQSVKYQIFMLFYFK